MDPQFNCYTTFAGAVTTDQHHPQEQEHPSLLYGGVFPSGLFFPNYEISPPSLSTGFIPPALDHEETRNDSYPTFADILATYHTNDLPDLETLDLHAPWIAPEIPSSWHPPQLSYANPPPLTLPTARDSFPEIAGTSNDPSLSTPPPDEPSNLERITPHDTNEDPSKRVWKYIDSKDGDGRFICLWECDTGKPCGYGSNLDLVKRHIRRVHFNLK